MQNAMMLQLDKIMQSSLNTRKHFDAEKLAELAASIKEKGVIEPIIVRKQAKGSSYEIVCGERRYRASHEAGLKDIPCVVMDLTDEQALEIQVIENLQRENLGVMEEAEGFQLMCEKYDIPAVASKVGKSETYIAGRLRLLSLPPKVKEAIAKDVIAPGHGLVIARLQDEEAQIRMLDAIVDDKLSIRASENMLNHHGKELAKASFDTEECICCANNGSTIQDLFDTDTNLKGRCLNAECFDKKCQVELDRKKKELTKKGNKVETEEQLKKRIKGYQRYNTAEIDEEAGKALGAKYGTKCRKCANRVFVVETLSTWDENSPKVITERCLKNFCFQKLTAPAPDPEEVKKNAAESKAEQEKQKAFEQLKKSVTAKLDGRAKLAVVIESLFEGFYDQTPQEIINSVCKKKVEEISLGFLLGLTEKVLEEILSEIAVSIVEHSRDMETLELIAKSAKK